MSIFRAISTILSASFVLSAVLHIVLLTSDSAEYRGWAYVQIALFLMSAWLLWLARNLKLPAIIGFVLIAISMIYINSVFLNYGNGPWLVVVPAGLLATYAAMACFLWNRSRTYSEPDGA